MKKDKYTPYFLLLPALLVIVFLYGYPVLLTFWQSFHKINLLDMKSTWVGTENYRKSVTDPLFYKTLGITVKYTAVTVFLKMGLGFLSAYLLHLDIFFRKQLRFLFLIPWAIPQVAVSVIWKWILDGNYGYLNMVLKNMGIIKKPLRFLSDPNLAFYSTSFVDTWVGIALVAMMLMASLDSVPLSFYEAASMDGAGSVRKFIDITVPGIKKTFMTVLILVTIWTFNSFNIIYVLTQGGPMRSLETITIRVYEEAFSRFELGMSATLSVVSFLILLFLTAIYMRGLFKDEKI